MITRWLRALGGAVCFSARIACAQQPEISYRVTVDSARTSELHVLLHLAHAPDRVRLAMKVHPEYDARFWRYLTFDDATTTRVDSTVWIATLAPGRRDVRYTIHLPIAAATQPRAWMTSVRADGAMLNPPDVFLYLPDFADAPADVHLEIPASWRVATSLPAVGPATDRRARNAATLLDSPIMLGVLHEWRFSDGANAFNIAYWPLADAVPFDTTAFVDGIQRLAHAADDVFGALPSSPFTFLVQDGAGDALEHGASVTIGVLSADLARDPRTHMTELAHEFFHTWNLVAIHPDAYGTLMSHRAPPTTGLWWGEGVTMHYADVLQRRAALADPAESRAAHLTDLLARYYAAPWSARVSPEAASLAFDRSPIEDPNATGGYYLQGDLLGEALDALIRDSTHDRRTLDDLMRAMYARSRGGRGFTSRELERASDAICSCDAGQFFAAYVRAPGLLDLGPAMRGLGWRIVVDTVAALDDAGAPLPDLRIGVVATDSTVRLVLSDPTSAWARAGLRTGDVLRSLGGTHPRTFLEFYNDRQRLHVGDTATVDVRRGTVPMTITLVVPGYARARVRLVDLPNATRSERARRARWLRGW